MPSQFTDASAPKWDASRPRPRGLLPVPAHVEQWVARQEAKQPMTPEFRRRLTDSLTLQFYYDNYTLAYRHTPQGVEVLAVGVVEIGQLLRGMSQEELLTIRTGQI